MADSFFSAIKNEWLRRFVFTTRPVGPASFQEVGGGRFPWQGGSRSRMETVEGDGDDAAARTVCVGQEARPALQAELLKEWRSAELLDEQDDVDGGRVQA
ncbi:hypothetical protein ACQP2T_34895 [Nonomuraea sp. CA-143628]|uniref:hypothetical protein n=1 Tax=Nonomuraea sp. CA-143628 TaxID=3239997 RepID=UPI003D89B846